MAGLGPSFWLLQLLIVSGGIVHGFPEKDDIARGNTVRPPPDRTTTPATSSTNRTPRPSSPTAAATPRKSKTEATTPSTVSVSYDPIEEGAGLHPSPSPSSSLLPTAPTVTVTVTTAKTVSTSTESTTEASTLPLDPEDNSLDEKDEAEQGSMKTTAPQATNTTPEASGASPVLFMDLALFLLLLLFNMGAVGYRVKTEFFEWDFD